MRAAKAMLVALSTLLTGCPQQHHGKHGGRIYRLMDLSDSTVLRARDPNDRGSLHPAVIHAILDRTELPFMPWPFSEERSQHHAEAARTLTPLINSYLWRNGSVLLSRGQNVVFLHVSRRGRMVVIQWQRTSVSGMSARTAPSPYYLLDLWDLPEAFSTKASLDLAKVQARARFYRGDF